MKRLGPAAVVLALCSVAPAGAHPGHGVESVTVDGDSLRYSPATATIGVGDAVVWFWEGTVTRNHSVTSDPGQAESFDSDPGGPPTNDSHPPGQGFSHVFTHEGRFTYYCQNHASMRGTVEVVGVPDPVSGRPRLRGLRVSPGGKRIDVRFRLSERADLVARVGKRRAGRWRTVETFYTSARAGRNRLRLPAKDLGHGRYRLTMTAYDDASRRSNVARERFSL